MSSFSKQFKYACTLRGHKADVRGLSTLEHDPGSIVSCSRDLTTKLWSTDSGELHYEPKTSFVGHTKFISCVATVKPIENIYPNGLVLTGSNDSNINVYLPEDSEPIMVLKGHTNAVSSIASGSFGIVFSGSWDTTARMWLLDTKGQKEGKSALVLSGHAAAVWDVLILPSQQGMVLTASADKTIKLWKAGKCLNTFVGHTDCVRGLAAVSSEQFLSCSNDASVKRWSIEGNCLQTYYGHTNFIYSIDYITGTSEFVTSSEDRTVKLWSISQGNPCQTLPTPAQSAWKVIALMNGDIAVGCSDGTIRLFSRDESRVANLDEKSFYEEELAQATIPESGLDIGDVNVNNLPGMEALEKPGKSDGQTVMIRKNNVVEAHQWSAAESKWMKVGDVVGSNTKGKKSMYQGQEYDYVFTVDIKEGSPPLHLPYNLTEDPWFAAQKFIDDNDLSQHFLDTVASFIIDNTKGAQVVQQAPASYSDPFTGQGRYTPISNNSGQSSNGYDPYTGAGRYVPSTSSASETSKKTAHDPMLNPSRYVPSVENGSGELSQTSATPMSVETNKYFPKVGYILFENRNISSILGKLKEFSVEAGDPMSNDDLTLLENLTKPGDLDVSGGVRLLLEVLQRNPSRVFPALDLLRCFVIARHDVIDIICGSKGEDMLELLIEHLQVHSPTVIVSNRLLAARILCNLFSSTAGLSFLLAGCERIFDAVSHLVPSDQTSSGSHNNAQVAIATLFINYAVLFNNKNNLSNEIISIYETLRLRCLTVISSFLTRSKHLSSEAVFRHLVAIGTLVSGHAVATASARSLDIKQIVATSATEHSSSEKVTECCGLVAALLH